MAERKFTSFEEFWPFYVREHSDPMCRAFHFVGTTLALLAVAASVFLGPVWLWAAPLAGYLFAWIGHFAFEHNRPATFRYPLWSLRGDFKMYGLMWLGRMGREIHP